MKIPSIQGIIDRRILINFTIDKEVLGNYLPDPFRPKLVGDKGIAGICLIRLRNIRPVGFPLNIGLSSENAAHRIAVEWTENGITKEGVYIPRRDTNSLLNHWAGGRLFPGVHHLSKFVVDEENDSYKINIVADDDNAISIVAKQADALAPGSVFKNIQIVSDFFRNGSIGFSPNGSGYDGLELRTKDWHIDPLAVHEVSSSFFENRYHFPAGSVQFDNALLMRNISHTWNAYENSFCH